MAPKNQRTRFAFELLIALAALCVILAPLATTAAAWPQHAAAPADAGVDPVTTSAEKGDAAAQLQLGKRYYEGTSREHPPDFEEALKWFHRAADQGNAEAQARIGMMYHFGKGVPRDDAEAARWYLLAANGGYAWAQLQLFNMYQEGRGVPRDPHEARKWLDLYNSHHPDHSTTYIRGLFALALLALIAFAIGLVALQRGRLSGGQHLAVAVCVHAAGIALVLNTLTTYGFWVVFPHCSHNFLATACTQIADPNTRKIVNEIGDWAVVNLIFRFMAGVGFILDALAAWYVVYLCRLLFERRRVQPRQAMPRTAPSTTARNS
jgi:Sel1 repeat-containing protein